MNDFGITEVEEVEEDSADLSDELEYPCLVLEGVTTFNELKYFVERSNRTDTVLSLYVKFEDVIKRVTTIDFSLEVLQLLHSINKNYKLWFHMSPFNQVELNLNEASTYIKLIKLK